MKLPAGICSCIRRVRDDKLRYNLHENSALFEYAATYSSPTLRKCSFDF
jgi:hypothetical protein